MGEHRRRLWFGDLGHLHLHSTKEINNVDTKKKISEEMKTTDNMKNKCLK